MSLFGFILLVLLVFSVDVLRVDAVGVVNLPVSPPAPQLVLVQVDGPVVVLQCRAPQGHGGRLFKLFRIQELVDTVQWGSEQTQAQFELGRDAVGQETHYCCQYDNSAISPYYTIRAAPRPITPPPPPQLSVTPPSERVLPGQVLDFHCQAPPTTAGNPPLTFVLQRRPRGADSDQVVRQSSDPHFSLGPVGQDEEGTYTCLYQIKLPDRLYDSTPSSPVSIFIAARLQTPQLSRDEDGVLVCTGSPSYPGAHYSLYHQGEELPIGNQRGLMGYRVRFSVPAQPGQGRYQCQYSVQLGNTWVHSERSAAITVLCITGSRSCSPSPPVYDPPPTEGVRVDLALIIGSVSAALLFLLVVFILSFTVHKHAKAAAVRRRQRKQDVFWQQIHSRDHVVDLTLPRGNITDFYGEEGRVSVSEPIYDYPFTSFTDPQK